MTTDTPTRPFRAIGTPGRRAGQALIDLGLGVRLALRSGRTGGLRLALTAVGVGLCVAVLLLGASLDRAQDRRQERTDALNPMTLTQQGAPPGAELFMALPYDQTFQGRLISGTELSPRGPAATPPPGVPTFPAAGTVVLSPALRDLLASPAGESLRPRFTEPVTGVIGDAGLTSPSDLRFYRGIEAPAGTFDGTDTYSDVVASGWGGMSRLQTETAAGELIRTAVVVGAAVVLLPLLIFVSLMSRLGAATRDRRTAALRMIGATGGQLRRVLAAETFVGALGGVLVGIVGFLTVRHAPWLRIGGDGFFPADIAPSPWLATAVVIGVPAVATSSAVLGSRFVTVERRSGRVATGGRVLLLLVVAGLIGIHVITPGLKLFGSAAMGVTATTVLLTLLLIPALLAPLLSQVARLVPRRSLTWTLAGRRIQGDVGTAARAVAGMCVVVAAGTTMLALLSITGTTSTNGYHPEQKPTQYRIQLSAVGHAEVNDMVERVQTVPGVDTVVGGSYVWMTARPSDGGFEVLIADCGDLTALGVPRCQEGDVFRVPQFGATRDGRPGDVLTPSRGDGGPEASWTVPPDVEDLAAPVGMTMFAPFLIATPSALGDDLDNFVATSFSSFEVDTDRPDALDDLRNAVGGFGARAAVTSPTEWAADSGRVQLSSTLQTGLILGGGLTLAVALAGLLVVAIEQLVGRRRALTLTVAAGVPRSVLARSVLVGALITGTTGALLGTAVGLLLAWYISAILFTTISLNALIVAAIAGVAVAATVLVTAATLPALSALTRLESLRTE